jgi:23S rRNA pseudouridine1911/1915/1917 synthase
LTKEAAENKQSTADRPAIIDAGPSYLVLYKPHNMHTAPLETGEGHNLLEWASLRFPEILLIHGKKPVEGGLLHRLDFETEGLVLVARTEEAFQSFSAQQEAGLFLKEYEALSTRRRHCLSGFPPPPIPFELLCEQAKHLSANSSPLVIIESGFRAYGPGRKSVRPVPDAGKNYTSQLVSIKDEGAALRFRIRLQKGFRHQIRCHLAWIGFPILNDSRYGGLSDGGALALKAVSIQFADPRSGAIKEYCI